ncbi:MAG TPA: PilZ domain-containing protein [Polyangia bacterium]
MTDSDRRTGARIPVKMWVEESSAGGLYFQRAANLSEGGIFLERTIPHPIGTMVSLQFTLPDEAEPLRVRAEIVNAAAAEAELGMGLRFVELAEPEAERIRRFVARHAGQNGG